MQCTKLTFAGLCLITLGWAGCANLFTSATAGNRQTVRKLLSQKKHQTIKKESLRYGGKPFEYWRNSWKTELKAEHRIETLRALAAFGVKGYAKEATQTVLEIVKEYSGQAFEFPYDSNGRRIAKTPDQKLIVEAGLALRRIGMAAVPVYAAELKNDNVRQFANLIFGPYGLGFNDEFVFPILIKLAQSKEIRVRQFAVRNLGQRLDTFYSSKVFKKFYEKEQNQKGFIKTLIDTLDESDDLPDCATPVLGKIGAQAIVAVPSLINCYARGYNSAYTALKLIGAKNSGVVPIVARQLKNKNVIVRQLAVEYLGELGPQAKIAIPSLVQALEDKNVDVQLAAIVTLKELNASPNQLVPALARLLTIKNGKNTKVRLAALKALTEAQAKPRLVVPALSVLLEDKNADRLVHKQSAEMLAEFGPEASAAVPALIQSLNYPLGYFRVSYKARLAAIRALGKIRDEPRLVVPILTKIFANTDERAEFRRAAALALGDYHKQSVAAVPSLLVAINDKDDYVKIGSTTLDALSQIGGKPQQLVPALIKALEYELEQDVRYAIDDNRNPKAIAMLGKYGKDAAPAIPVLIRAYKHHPIAVMKTLGKIGPEAKPALPKLQKAAQSRSASLRRAATEALRLINEKN